MEQSSSKDRLPGGCKRRFQPSRVCRSFAIAVTLAMLSFATPVWQVRTAIQKIDPAHSNVLRMWNATENKAMNVRNWAKNNYEAIRLVYGFVRQLKDLQKQETSEQHVENSQAAPCRASCCLRTRVTTLASLSL